MCGEKAELLSERESKCVLADAVWERIKFGDFIPHFGHARVVPRGILTLI
jgi:hypothetical protein